jgi:hypothetical protein
MTTRTGSPDIMSVGSDLREQSLAVNPDMMTGFAHPMIVDHRDLRKHSVRRDLSEEADIMSRSLSPITARSGRRSP